MKNKTKFALFSRLFFAFSSRLFLAFFASFSHPFLPSSRAHLYEHTIDTNIDMLSTSPLKESVPMFPGTYVPRYLCSPVPMFPGTYVSRYLCSPVPMFPEPMFPGAYVPRYLCSPVPMFPGFCTLIVVISINRFANSPHPLVR